ncbi:hypothetical protein [Breznakiella homolactica]|uniref:Uncharacterized protein n=1 Tax=Breznakiella homolactica TaxID=2798577 RepID=A0A7T8B9R1_9SPIR|nr:hypothetical protein [Breznakiella homolactica]QQO08225.1 hypothetical protein JFL75_14970 [Breznakiella homolactica]
MPGRRKLFLAMICAEVEDSLEDVEFVSAEIERRFRNNEVTNYVYSENEALLAREASGLKKLIAFLQSVSPDDYESAADIAAFFEETLRNKVKELDNHQAVYEIIDRKIKKVLKYINESSC